MTRKEQITLHANAIFPHGFDTLGYDSAALASVGFEVGANWADEHPNLSTFWHTITDEPRYREPLLIESLKYEFTVDTRVDDSVSWDSYVKFNKILKWMYISDLLPKEYELSELKYY